MLRVYEKDLTGTAWCSSGNKKSPRAGAMAGHLCGWIISNRAF